MLPFALTSSTSVRLAMLFAAFALADHLLARVDPRIRPWGQLIPACAWLLWAGVRQPGTGPGAGLDDAIMIPALGLLSLAFAGVWAAGLIRCLGKWRGRWKPSHRQPDPSKEHPWN